MNEEIIERCIPPSPGAIDRMNETFGWYFWIGDEEKRKIVWMQSAGVRWQAMKKIFGLSRTTLHHRHREAIFEVYARLKAEQEGGDDVRQK